tara:strand:- start:17 stop:118 length:102 start_codon:yes stop_codon:yes gene_type:complete
MGARHSFSADEHGFVAQVIERRTMKPFDGDCTA